MNFKESIRGVTNNIRKTRIESKGGVCLDKDCVLYCDKPVPGVLDIHITKGLTKGIFYEAYKNLLEIVEEDVSIQKIQMVSPVLVKNFALIERLGFEIDNSLTDEVKAEINTEFPKNMQGKPFVQMVISREKLLINKKITSDN